MGPMTRKFWAKAEQETLPSFSRNVAKSDAPNSTHCAANRLRRSFQTISDQELFHHRFPPRWSWDLVPYMLVCLHASATPEEVRRRGLELRRAILILDQSSIASFVRQYHSLSRFHKSKALTVTQATATMVMVIRISLAK